MPELYRLTDGTVDNGQLTIDNDIDAIIGELAQRIYDGENITFDHDLLQATAKTYLDAVEKGYGKRLPDVDWNSPDFKTLEKLTENVFKFSASKNYNTLRDMSLLLKDGDHIRSFDDFQKEVDKLNVKYNHNWLRTEYNQAVSSSQCAARWTDYGKHADKNPFLQYQAVMDANTRAEHAALHGIVKRYDDEFWDKYYPPNGWGCRCEVIQLPGKNHKETPAADIKYCNVPAAFKVNVGKTGKIFSEEHPYFMQRCKNCRTQLGNPDPNNPQCQACTYGMAQCRTFVEDCKVKASRYHINERDFEELKKTWTITNKSGKELTADLLNESVAGGFNFLQLSQVIRERLNTLHIDEPLKQHITISSKGVVRYELRNNIVRVARKFYKDNGKLVAFHTHIAVAEQYRRKHIALAVQTNLLQQYKSMGVDKIQFVTKREGGFVWADCGFYAKDRYTVAKIIGDNEAAKKIVAQYYEQECKNDNEPFPMKRLAKDEFKELLNGASWTAEVDLNNPQQMEDIKRLGLGPECIYY